MPPTNLHMTALEVTHSLTAPEITPLINRLSPLIPAMTDYPSTSTHRARLIKPLLSYDSAAVALSFLPAASEALPSPSDPSREPADDSFTYHHLRRDLYAMTLSNDITIESRYEVPSAHITIGRFVTQRDHESSDKMAGWVREIEAINEWLEREYWPQEGGKEGGGKGEMIKVGGEWIVGQERGLDLRKGTLWYGGGETVRLGKGF